MRLEPVRLTIVLSLASAASARADEPAAEIVRIGAVPESVAGVNALLIPPSDVTDAPIAAAFTTVPSGTQFRATFAPLQTLPYHEVVSELRLSTVYDSKTNLFTIGASVAYNPFSWHGERVFELIEELDQRAGCGHAYNRTMDPALEREEHARTALAKARTETDPAGTDPAAIARASDELNAATRAVDDILRQAKKVEGQCIQRRERRKTAEVYRAWVPYIAASVAVGVFPSGEGADPLNSMLTAPLEPWGGVSTNLDVQFRPSLRGMLEVWGTYKNTRPTGAPRTQLSNSEGVGVTASYLAWQFQSREKLMDNPDYREHGLVPGIALGGSVQYLHCDGGVYCDNSKIDDVSVTPFFEVRAKQALQFRVSFPVERARTVGAPLGTSVAPTFTVGGAVGGL